MKLNTKQPLSTTTADIEAKAGILNFIIENSGAYYEVGIQMAFPNYSAEYLRELLRQLEEEGKITNDDCLSPYMVVETKLV